MVILPRISVIMLTYNRENFVSNMIENILAQTFSDFEYIIIDNGSTDGSGEICRRYAEKDRRIRLISRPRGTIGSGRNTGLDAAVGEYITFVDDDDICKPDMLEFLYNLAKQHNADISLCGSDKEINGEVFLNCAFEGFRIWTAEEAEIELLKRQLFNTAFPTKMINARLFDGMRFPEGGNYDDIALMYKTIARAEIIVADGMPKYTFRRHARNNSAFTGNDNLITPSQLEEYFSAYRERTEYLCAKFPSSRDYFRYSEWSFLISMCNKIISNRLNNCMEQLEYARDFLQNDRGLFLNSTYIKDFEKEWVERYI